MIRLVNIRATYKSEVHRVGFLLTVSQLTWASGGITEGGGKSVFQGRSKKFACNAAVTERPGI